MQFLEEHKMVMKWVLMGGIIFFHSQYAVMQETLLGDKSLRLNVNVVLLFQYVIAIAVAGFILALYG